MSTAELIDMLRKDAALCWAIRDAAQREAEAINRIVVALGDRRRKDGDLDAPAEALKSARSNLVAAWGKLVEFEKSKRIDD